MFSTLRALVATLAGILFVTALPVLAGAPAEDPAHDFWRQYFEECLNQPGDYGCLGDFWTSDRVDGVRRSEETRRSVFPDLEYEIVEILVDGDRVAIRCRVTGNASGPAAAATGGRLEIDEAFFYQVKDGKIESGKPFSDRWAVAQALGYRVTAP